MYNALIIDDEKHVRQTITILGMWKKHGINPPLEATDGQSAIDLMGQTAVDIVLVDIKMPVMDGMQFLEVATRRFPKAKYIIISGFNDFEYAKKAIQFQIMDYLLKPVSETELNHCLESAVKQLDDELALTKANPLADLINLFCSRSSSGTYCAIASLRIGKPVPPEFSWNPETLRLLSALLTSHASSEEEYIIRTEQPELLIIGIFIADNHNLASHLPDMLPLHIADHMKQALSDFCQRTGVITLTGIGSFAPASVSALKESSKTAALITSRMNLYSHTSMLSSDIELYAARIPASLSSVRDLLRRALGKWDEKYFRSILEQYFEFQLAKSLVTAESLKHNTVELLIIMQNFSLENLVENYQEVLPSSQETEEQAAITGIQTFLDYFCTLFRELRSQKEDASQLTVSDILQEIKTYIEVNYAKEITLTFFSEKYHLTKEYLSKQYKEKYGYGIYEYLLSFRMQRAGELLLTSPMKIQEVSDRVGYTDTNYFSKAFKTYYNMSPKEYRQKKQS